MNRKGYTMIELSIALIILAIISVIAMIAIANSMRAMSISNAANKLATDLTFAQSLAAAAGQWYGVSVEVSPLDQYTVFVTTGTADSTVDNPGKRGSPMVINLKNDYGVSISSVNIAGGNKVAFNPIGTPYNNKSGSALAAEGVITISKDLTSRTVRITPNTGRIYIQ